MEAPEGRRADQEESRNLEKRGLGGEGEAVRIGEGSRSETLNKAILGLDRV